MPEAVEPVAVEHSAMFEVTPITGILKETVQNGQQLIWRAGGTRTGEPRFEITDMSAAFLRSEAPGDVKITFSGHVSAFGWRPVDEAKVNLIVRTRGGASIYSWLINVSVQCADNNRTLTPFTRQVPSDLAVNLFNSVGAVEISEFREPNTQRLRARRCRSQAQ
jgi:hypothetical protein